MTATTLSSRLRTETNVQHERMHGLMAKADPFASREGYARFVAAQYLFQRDVEALFEQPGMRDLVPDLDIRGRQEASELDLRDLNTPVPTGDIASVGVKLPEALGWLYVSEGSTLGAAFLFKEANEKLQLTAEFGARNLAAYPEGRARAWKAFVKSMDESGYSQEDQDKVVAGANAAYDRFGQLLESFFSLEAA